MNAEVVIASIDLGGIRAENEKAVIRHLWSNGFAQKTLCVQPPRRVGMNIAAARNIGAATVRKKIVVFNDADSICPPDQIREAIKLANESPGLVFAYDLYCRVDEAQSNLYRNHPNGDLFALPVERMIHNSGSMACVAISKTCFHKVTGNHLGFDESYVGWGYEDLDFAQRCNALWPNRRVPGPVYHLWHGDRRDDDSPEDSDPDQVRQNHARWLASA